MPSEIMCVWKKDFGPFLIVKLSGVEKKSPISYNIQIRISYSFARQENMNDYMFISILAVVSITITLAVVMLLVKKKKSGPAPRSAGRIEQPSRLKAGKWQGQHEGIGYAWEYSRGSRNSPSYVLVSVNCQSSGSFKITKESAFDRFFKKRGICCEILTHDSEFDEKFFITTNTVNFTSHFFGKAQKRKIVNEIYDKGFKEISHNGKVMMAKWSPVRSGKNFDMKLIEEIAVLLDQLAGDLPLAPTPSAFVSTGWKTKRTAAFAVPILLEILGITALVLGLTKYRPLDGWNLVSSTLKLSIPLLLIFLWLAVQLLRGRSSSHRELIVVAILAISGFLSAGAGFGMFLNGYLDTAQPVNHETLVVGKHISRSDKSTSYYAHVQSWRKEGEKESLKISRHEYDRIIADKTEATVTTKPGKFKYEWLAGRKFYF
jgi:hypothetical protein